MTFKPPLKIEITSDGSILQFVKIKPITAKQKVVLYNYEYIKAIGKEGCKVDWTQDYITQQLKNYFKEIK